MNTTTRKGKIARLPRAVREELNRRLREGEEAVRLVAWLNGRQDVRALLKAGATGSGGPSCAEPAAGRRKTGQRSGCRNPWITPQNLSVWRQGGFADWMEQQESQSLAGEILEQAKELDDATKGEVLSHLVAQTAALAVARLLQGTMRMEEGPQKVRTTLKVVRAVVRLRTADRQHDGWRMGWAGRSRGATCRPGESSQLQQNPTKSGRAEGGAGLNRQQGRRHKEPGNDLGEGQGWGRFAGANSAGDP